MPARKRSVTQHSTSRPKGELSTLERAEYYDKWRALKDDIQTTLTAENVQGLERPETNALAKILMGRIIERMDEYEKGLR